MIKAKGRKLKITETKMESKNTFQKLSDEIKQKISAQLKEKEVQEMISKIKNAEDSGRFEVVISTGDVDRMGESISPTGWDLQFYKMNPIVLWAHDYSDLPIGMTESIELKDGKLVASGKFAPADANPKAQFARKLYDAGFLWATSVGFIEKERQDNVITKAELLEWSFVPVPANPFALSTLSKAGIDTEAFITKGLILPVKDEKEQKDEESLIEKISEQLIQLQTTIETNHKNILEILDKKQTGVLDEKLQGGRPEEGANTGRDPAGSEKELDQFISLQQVLRQVDLALEDGLKKIKKKIRFSEK